METRGFVCREVVPFIAMVSMHCIEVGMNTLFKAAALKGMSYRVFIVYSYALAGLVLLPISFIWNRGKQLPPFSSSILFRICLLGILGFSAQMLGYKGIDYSSPTLASAISNLSPAFTFILAVILRMERLELRSASSRAKIIGATVSMSGTLVMILYKGPMLLRISPPSISLHHLTSSQSDWFLGVLLLTIDYVLLSTWFIVQSQTVRMYPAELTLASLHNLSVAVIAAPFCFFLEPNIGAWKFTTQEMLFSILYAGMLGFGLGTVILIWILSWKGPVYAALFTPLSIAIAAILGFFFLGDSIFLGSVMGAVIISVGFYACMWGKAKEEEVSSSSSSSPSSSAESLPLLQ